MYLAVVEVKILHQKSGKMHSSPPSETNNLELSTDFDVYMTVHR
jgi:hypothetical protein